MFILTDQPIQIRTPSLTTSGGYVSFEGRIRSSNEGRPVLRLEYEAYPELAVSEGDALVNEAIRIYGLDWAQVTHRTGLLELGEVAVWIGCSAPHRKEAFEACEFLIDELKKRLPIWKKEHYADGQSEWVNLRSSLPDQVRRSDIFDRQLTMPEVGPEGQLKLQSARVLVVGAGGLGNAALPYLAAAGIGTIGIIEPDILDVTNLHRQVLFGYEQAGMSKARLAAGALRKLHPFVQTQVHEVYLNPENAVELMGGYDVVIDGTDRFDAKFLMNDVCQRLGIPLVQASIFRMEGYIQTLLPGGPCLRCMWPEAPEDGCVETCAESGVLGVLPGIMGTLQAAETIKLILGIGEDLGQHQLLIDLRDYNIQRIKRLRQAGCPACTGRIWTKRDSLTNFEVTMEEARSWSGHVCLDLREPNEPDDRLPLSQSDWLRTPLSQFRSSDVPKDRRVLLVCATGRRSGRLAFKLRDLGFDNVYSLKSGVSG